MVWVLKIISWSSKSNHCLKRWLVISLYSAPFLKIPTVQSLEQLYPLTFLLLSDSTSSQFPLHSLNLRVNRPCCASPLKAFDLDLPSGPALSQSAFRTTSRLSVLTDSKRALCVSACSAWRDSAGVDLHSARHSYCTANDMKDSFLDRFRKSNLCFMDSLSSLSSGLTPSASIDLLL